MYCFSSWKPTAISAKDTAATLQLQLVKNGHFGIWTMTSQIVLPLCNAYNPSWLKSQQNSTPCIFKCSGLIHSRCALWLYIQGWQCPDSKRRTCQLYFQGDDRGGAQRSQCQPPQPPLEAVSWPRRTCPVALQSPPAVAAAARVMQMTGSQCSRWALWFTTCNRSKVQRVWQWKSKYSQLRTRYHSHTVHGWSSGSESELPWFNYAVTLPPCPLRSSALRPGPLCLRVRHLVVSNNQHLLPLFGSNQ